MRDSVSVRALRIVLLVAILVVVVLTAPGAAWAQQTPDEPPVSQEDEPYQAAIPTVEPPDWLEPLGPLASLPVWAIAAVLAAMAAALFIVIPAGVKWVWVMQSTRDSE